ncbi:hypothetical protein B484DRAFT_446056 [Ochromonadaceae sp. CCMP2298]|nr:hypothetical protein B484DRAFT_446056 [Ochromonadaceae sp. CCMP2298]
MRILLGLILACCVAGAVSTAAVKVKVSKRRQPAVDSSTEDVEPRLGKRPCKDAEELVESVDERERQKPKKKRTKSPVAGKDGSYKPRRKPKARMSLWHMLKSFLLSLVDPTVGGAIEVDKSASR